MLCEANIWPLKGFLQSRVGQDRHEPCESGSFAQAARESYVALGGMNSLCMIYDGVEVQGAIGESSCLCALEKTVIYGDFWRLCVVFSISFKIRTTKGQPGSLH